jgi:hypothetical protein
VNDDDPVRFAVEYPDRDLNRLTTALRIFTVIPIAILLVSCPPRELLGASDERTSPKSMGISCRPSPRCRGLQIGGTPAKP